MWAPCSYGGFYSGVLGVTSDRVLFVAHLGPEHSVEHRLAEDREATVWDSGFRINFADGTFSFVGLETGLARELVASVVPGFAERFFGDDPAMMERLRARHEKIAERAPITAPPPPTATVVVKGCRYLGGFSHLAPSGRFVSVSLLFEPGEIVVQWMRKPVFRVSDPKRGTVEIAGREQLQQRLTATRLAGFGVFALAAPKKIKRSTSYITIAIANGEMGIFEVENTDPMKLRADLSPWLAEH